MAKTTFIVSFYWFLFTLSASAQDNKQQPKTQETAAIEGLSLYRTL
jgi:preprotein translocase subunit SecG